MKFIQTFFIAGLLALVFVSCKKDKDNTPGVPAKKIAYVYKTDVTEAAAFKALLDSNNCSVTLVEKNNVASFNFSNMDLVVIGSNTDVTQLVPDWSTAQADAINKPNKPILLMGIGGLQLAEKLGNTVNYLVCSGHTLTSFATIDETDAVYKKPKAIVTSTGNPLEIFAVSHAAQGFVNTGGVTPNVLTIGRTSPASGDYPVLIESDRFGVFGYTHGVNDMTKTGRDFIVNFVYRVGKF